MTPQPQNPKTPKPQLVHMRLIILNFITIMSNFRSRSKLRNFRKYNLNFESGIEVEEEDYDIEDEISPMKTVNFRFCLISHWFVPGFN